MSTGSPFHGLPGHHGGFSREELAETAALFPATKAAVLRVLASSSHFRLVPEQAVLSSGIYAAARGGDPNRFGGNPVVTAPGYKLLLETDQVRAVARAVGARAGMIVSIDHRCSWGDQAGTVVGDVSVYIWAFDRAGETVWMAHEGVSSDIPVPVGDGGVDVHALRRSLVQSAERATREILRTLDRDLRAH